MSLLVFLISFIPLWHIGFLLLVVCIFQVGLYPTIIFLWSTCEWLALSAVCFSELYNFIRYLFRYTNISMFPLNRLNDPREGVVPSSSQPTTCRQVPRARRAKLIATPVLTALLGWRDFSVRWAQDLTEANENLISDYPSTCSNIMHTCM
jgi:hypothetical protein